MSVSPMTTIRRFGADARTAVRKRRASFEVANRELIEKIDASIASVPFVAILAFALPNSTKRSELGRVTRPAATASASAESNPIGATRLISFTAGATECFGKRRIERSRKDRVDDAAEFFILSVPKRVDDLQNDERMQVVIGKMMWDASRMRAHERRCVHFQGGLERAVAREERRAEVAKDGGKDAGIRGGDGRRAAPAECPRSERARMARRFPAAAIRSPGGRVREEGRPVWNEASRPTGRSLRAP